MNRLQMLVELGQSIWLDNINRDMLLTGKLKEFIDLGIRGLTSNPTIFDKAIRLSDSYDDEIANLASKGYSPLEIYDSLTIKDIQYAADLFLPIYEESRHNDGFVSLEVSPKLAFNVEETIREAKRLKEKVACPNVMFKIPATEEGFFAIERLISEGINVNVTLIFSPKQYEKAAQAYIKGLQNLMNKKAHAIEVSSVASVFVSRIDTFVDKRLDEMLSSSDIDNAKRKKILSLLGKSAVANCRIIFEKFKMLFSSPEFLELKEKGANIQRLLWGSTSTKNPKYSDVKYVEELIAKDTINTLPEHTIYAFLDHGEVKEALTDPVEKAEKILTSLKEVGIDINEVCQDLLLKGLKAFEDSFDSLLSTIEEKTQKLLKNLDN